MLSSRTRSFAGVCESLQVLCHVLKRAELDGKKTTPEQDKQECTQKTAAEQAGQGSGRVGCATTLRDNGEGEPLSEIGPTHCVPQERMVRA